MPRRVRRVAILGVGLLGGSLGLRWRQRGAVEAVVGFSRSRASAERGLALGALDAVAPDLESAVRGADLVVLCAPVTACLELGPRVAALAAAGCLITDVCSTKAALEAAMLAALEARGPGPLFVGGHPMAGAERGGVEAADPYLFEQAVWALCPPAGTPPPAVDSLAALVEAAGAHPVLLDARVHDRRVAAVSHLPQLAAVALAEAVGGGEERDPGLLALAGGGFRDTTRIAQSPSEMWLDVLATNTGPILDELDRYAAGLARLRHAVADGDRAAITGHFASAAAVRARVPTRHKGLLPAYHDLVLFVPDRPGMIGRLCGALGERGINVQDIEILRLREGEGGTLRLGFATPAEQAAAQDVLAGIGCAAQRR